MTCGIDGDDDDQYSYYGWTLIPLNNLEKLQGRDIQKLEASQSLLRIIELILSGFRIHEDKHTSYLIPSPKELPSLKGRHIQQLDASHSLLHRGISVPIIPKEKPDSNGIVA